MFRVLSNLGCAALTAVIIVHLFPWPSSAQTASATQVQPDARIVAPPPNYEFPNGKKFVYSAEWHMFTAGMATMRLDSDETGEKLTGTATSAGAVNFLFPVHNSFDARINPQAYCSTRVFKHVEEGKRKKEIQIQVDPGRRLTVVDEKDLKTGETKHEENDSPPCATDILSGFFYVGSLPLLPGTVESFPVVDGGKPTITQARVEGNEEVKVPAGDYHAIRVAVEPLSGKFQGKGKIWVWYSDDGLHLPVQMRAKIQWGTVTFKLQRIEQ